MERSELKKAERESIADGVELCSIRYMTYIYHFRILSSFYLPPPPQKKKTTTTLFAVVEVADYTFLCLFMVEAILKIIAVGFSSYISDGSNTLDIVVLTENIIELSVKDRLR